MLIDGLDGERYDIETASDERLATMEADYVRYADTDHLRANLAEIRAEIERRKS